MDKQLQCLVVHKTGFNACPIKNPIQCLVTSLTLCLPLQSNQESCSSTELPRLTVKRNVPIDRQRCSGSQMKHTLLPRGRPALPQMNEAVPFLYQTIKSADDTHQNTDTHTQAPDSLISTCTLGNTHTTHTVRGTHDVFDAITIKFLLLFF